MDTYPYPYFGTAEDSPDNLLAAFGNSANLMENAVRLAGEIAGRMALRLTHDRELYLDYKSYDSRLHNFVSSLLPHQKEMRVRLPNLGGPGPLGTPCHSTLVPAVPWAQVRGHEQGRQCRADAHGPVCVGAHRRANFGSWCFSLRAVSPKKSETFAL